MEAILLPPPLLPARATQRRSRRARQSQGAKLSGAVCGTALGDRVSWELICQQPLPCHPALAQGCPVPSDVHTAPSTNHQGLDSAFQAHSKDLRFCLCSSPRQTPGRGPS